MKVLTKKTDKRYSPRTKTSRVSHSECSGSVSREIWYQAYRGTVASDVEAMMAGA
jgi:hypothetical protein